MTREWPRCGKCHRSILVHTIRGLVAYCEPVASIGRPVTPPRATFDVAQVGEVRSALGLRVTYAMAAKIAKFQNGRR